MGEPVTEATRVGIVGLGVISGAYLDTLSAVSGVRITAVADLDAARAEAAAARIPGARALSPAELTASDEVDVVLNLTVPGAHADVALAGIAAGKDVFGEKPLAATLEDALRMRDAAAAAGVHLGAAPDTALGTGVQTARRAVEAGGVGVPVSASATWLSAGHEAWHPHPDFYYRRGGGPMLDMGPYYLTALVHLLGDVGWVQGATARAFDERTIRTGPRAGERIPVEVDTHVAGILGHRGGALSTVTFSFDAPIGQTPPIEMHGRDGVLVLPDPNHFDGTVRLWRHDGAAAGMPTTSAGEDGWIDLAPSAGYEDAGRGIGLIDFAAGARRASGDLALHVLEVMSALEESAQTGRRVDVRSRAALPPLVPLTPASRWRTGATV